MNDSTRYSDYLIELSDMAANRPFWDEADFYRLHTQLWHLMEKQTWRYTMGDSSSIPLEIAEELKKSMYFCIGAYLKKNRDIEENIHLIKTVALEEIFQKGQAEVLALVEKGKELFQTVKERALNTNNISYNDTLNEIAVFFQKYDALLMAHEIPCMIDYQLLCPLPELEGIEYINAYLDSLLIENAFCNKFSLNSLNVLLQSAGINYEEDLINLCEYTLNNAIGLKLLNKEVYDLTLRKRDIRDLEKMAKENDPNVLSFKIDNAVKAILSEFNLREYEDYFKELTSNLLVRMENLKNIGYDNLFVLCLGGTD